MRNKFPQFKEKDLVYFGWRNEPYFASSNIIEGMNNRAAIKKYFGLNSGIGMLQVNCDFYSLKKDMDAFTAEFEKKFQTTDKHYGPKVVNNCFSSGEHLVKTAKVIYHTAIKKQLPAAQIINLISTFHKEARNYCAYYLVAWFDAPGKALAQHLADKYSSTPAQSKRLYEIITSPSQETAAEHEQTDFLKLCSLKLFKKMLEKRAANHAKKYGWLGIRYYVGNAWTQADILERMRHKNAKTAAQELGHILDYRKNLERDLKLFLKRATAQERTMVAYIRDVVFLRTQRANYFHLASFYMLPLLWQAADRLNLNLDELLNFKPTEIIHAIKYGENLKSAARERSKNLVMLIREEPQCLAGSTANEYIKKHPFLARNVRPVTSISGTSAYEGKVTGQVKIVFSGKELGKVKKGDILVTNMTIPPYIAAMERAVAFVTDEGGILCHAAIVAREMKKPCIIGTKIATKVFKDGDTVEVDANKGIVRKIR